MNYEGLSYILFFVFVIGVFIFIAYYFIYLVPHEEKVLEESTCETLLKRIKTTIPNYQYDVREWVSKECYK